MLAIEKQDALAEANSARLAPPLTPRFLKIEAAAKFASLSRSTIYSLLGEGKIKSHKIGASRVICVDSLERFITSQPAE